MKKFKNICLILISCIMLSTGIVFSEPNAQVQQPNANQEVVSETETNTINNIPETIPEKNAENLKKIKNSAQTSDLFNIIKVFILCGIFFFILFFSYKLYSKLKNRGYIIEAPAKETLATPKDFKSAINLFLGKTDE